mmetsp:Transcript_2378/g.5039  ORF Transcript_2378/g.5039 Transcript_2378/m.5039 type:complete len:729 (-) Transcript_2378:33-2219(-)
MSDAGVVADIVVPAQCAQRIANLESACEAQAQHLHHIYSLLNETRSKADTDYKTLAAVHVEQLDGVLKKLETFASFKDVEAVAEQVASKSNELQTLSSAVQALGSKVDGLLHMEPAMEEYALVTTLKTKASGQDLKQLCSRLHETAASSKVEVESLIKASETAALAAVAEIRKAHDALDSDMHGELSQVQLEVNELQDTLPKTAQKLQDMLSKTEASVAGSASELFAFKAAVETKFQVQDAQGADAQREISQVAARLSQMHVDTEEALASRLSEARAEVQAGMSWVKDAVAKAEADQKTQSAQFSSLSERQMKFQTSLDEAREELRVFQMAAEAKFKAHDAHDAEMHHEITQVAERFSKMQVETEEAWANRLASAHAEAKADMKWVKDAFDKAEAAMNTQSAQLVSFAEAQQVKFKALSDAVHRCAFADDVPTLKQFHILGEALNRLEEKATSASQQLLTFKESIENQVCSMRQMTSAATDGLQQKLQQDLEKRTALIAKENSSTLATKADFKSLLGTVTATQAQLKRTASEVENLQESSSTMATQSDLKSLLGTVAATQAQLEQTASEVVNLQALSASFAAMKKTLNETAQGVEGLQASAEAVKMMQLHVKDTVTDVALLQDNMLEVQKRLRSLQGELRTAKLETSFAPLSRVESGAGLNSLGASTDIVLARDATQGMKTPAPGIPATPRIPCTPCVPTGITGTPGVEPLLKRARCTPGRPGSRTPV